MIVRSLQDIAGTHQDIDSEQWHSRRLLLAADKLGYSLHDTIAKAGARYTLEYLHHVESVYCVSGEGEIEDHATGRTHPLRDGTVYVLDQHDRHTLSAHTEMRFICVFTPAVTGTEVHDENGAYPPPADHASAA
ncbi:ectoine synthase [Streptomyces sp. TRM 70351]|uniref:ectoine synthase n=1 Tax=Streptomyces sp. TRM 70351 TaxID=3116552 RepID=UPI002E7AE694|nr:ectoine synthase [Streptomyces sp. TRM 70351]MEE1927850.1 ectoine synthase [Streptomyces sp. TRM 70351]